jgi:hypothetical protein
MEGSGVDLDKLYAEWGEEEVRRLAPEVDFNKIKRILSGK